MALREPVPAGEEEHRRSARRRVLLGGKLVFGPTDITLDCTIRDLSEKGARVRIASPVPLPDTVWLIELRNGLAFESHVAWRRVPEFGLEFRKVHDLSTTDRPELWMMKRIWVENSAR